MSKYDPILTGNRIKLCRESRGLTLDNIAVLIGVARSTIQRYEAGVIKRPKLPVIDSIAKVLDVDPSWLLNKTSQQGTYYKNSFSSSISPASSKLNDKFLPLDEQELLNLYRQVNSEGQSYIIKQAKFAAAQDEYKRPSPAQSTESAG